MAFGTAGQQFAQLFGSGMAGVSKLGRGYGLIEIVDQAAPSLARSVAFVGFLDECLRAAGARDVEVRLTRVAALGDRGDLFEATWST
ncbi:MAG: hypothetical protein H5U40_15620 [Polyangiaceae bacterium]|nr:hypothetical protein [Polyangiaceae bacterium]